MIQKVGAQEELTFLIIEDNLIIAEDVAEAIREVAPQAEIHVWTRQAATADAVLALPRICAAFVSLSTQDIAASGLDAAIAENGGTLVVLNDADPAGVRPGWWFVPRPFSTANLHEVLRVLGLVRIAGGP